MGDLITIIREHLEKKKSEKSNFKVVLPLNVVPLPEHS